MATTGQVEKAAPAVAASVSTPERHDGPPQTSDATVSTPPPPAVAAVGIAAPSAPPSPGPADNQPAAPVADQLTRAFVAQADVVHRDGQTVFHLRLEPPQLGTVQIHLRATDHTISARIVTAQDGTRQLLQDQAHHLRQSLAQAGVSLTGFDVSSGGSGSRGGQQPPPQRRPRPSPRSLRRCAPPPP